MSAHRPVLGHRAQPVQGRDECRTCGRTLVFVEDTIDLTPHWRHKPQGYHWGDMARYWKDRALAAEEQLARLTA